MSPLQAVAVDAPPAGRSNIANAAAAAAPEPSVVLDAPFEQVSDGWRNSYSIVLCVNVLFDFYSSCSCLFFNSCLEKPP